MKKLMLSVAMTMGLSVANSQIKFTSTYWVYSQSGGDTLIGDWQETTCYFTCDRKKNVLSVKAPDFESYYEVGKKEYSSKHKLDDGTIEKKTIYRAKDDHGTQCFVYLVRIKHSLIKGIITLRYSNARFVFYSPTESKIRVK